MNTLLRKEKKDKIRILVPFFFFLLSAMILANGRFTFCQEESSVELLYFYSQTCDDCQFVEEFVLEPLQEAYPIQVIHVSVDEKEGYERLLFMEEITGDTDNQIPVIFIANKAFGGIQEIETSLEETIKNIMEARKNGSDISVIPTTPQKPPAKPKPEPEPKPGVSPQKPSPPLDHAAEQFQVYAAYFEKQGCTSCSRAYRDLQYLQSKYPNLIIKVYDIADHESKVLNEALGQICHVPEKKRLTAPSIFIGKDFLLEEDIRIHAMEELIRKHSREKTASPWEMAEKVKKEAGKTIVSRFKGLNISTIMAAGLLDGINPCAFATIIFFISYLAYIGRKGKEILLVGGAFTFAVFITYMLIGLGFLSFIKSLFFLPLLSKIVYLATAIFALALGILSLRDYFLCRKGKIEAMSLQLPDFLKKRIHKTIRQEAKVKRYIVGALITGFIISVLELACTGQVYLPTIIFVSRISTLRLRSMFYLLLYNLMFISPLALIFITVYKGTSSQQLTALFQRSSAAIKLGMSLLFFTLAIVLIVTLL